MLDKLIKINERDTKEPSEKRSSSKLEKLAVFEYKSSILQKAYGLGQHGK